MPSPCAHNRRATPSTASGWLRWRPEAGRGQKRVQSQVALDTRAECFGVLVDLFQRANRHPRLLPVVVENADVLLGAVEVQSRDRLAVVVVQQHREIRFGIPLRYASGLD